MYETGMSITFQFRIESRMRQRLSVSSNAAVVELYDRESSEILKINFRLNNLLFLIVEKW